MNWQAIGAIGELGGALAVVVSIAYLAIQIRQNTKAVRGSTIHSVTESMQFELHWSREIGDIWTRANENPDQITSLQAWILNLWLMSSLMTRQNEYIQYTHGMLDDEVWSVSERIIAMILGNRWARNWWEAFGHDAYTPTFRAVVDTILESAPSFEWDHILQQIQSRSDSHREHGEPTSPY